MSLLYLKRNFCNVEFFYIDFDYYFFKTQKQQLGVFYKTDFLKNFTKFTGKHLQQISFWRPATLLKQDSRTSILQNICERLLLEKEAPTVTTRSEARQKNWGFLHRRAGFLCFKYLQQKKYEVIQIFVYCIKLDENKASDRTFIQGHSETLSYSNFFILWSPYYLKHLILRTFSTSSN